MKPSMKTASKEGGDNLLDTTSSNNVTGRGVHRSIRTRRSIRKKQIQRNKGFFQHYLTQPFLPDGNFEDINKLRKEELVMSVVKADRKFYKWLISMSQNTANNYLDPRQEATRLLPKTLVILCCERCQSYSHSAKARFWLKAPTNHESPMLKAFLLKKLGYYCALLGLKMTHSWFVSWDSRRISIGFELDFQAPAGVWHKQSSVVVYKLANSICPSCSSLVDQTQPCSVVQLRHYVADNRAVRLLQLRVQRTDQPVGSCTFTIQKITPADYGVDFFLPNDGDAMSLYSVLKSYAPVKHDEIHTSSSSTSTDQNTTVRSVISAVVCPICKDDLVYLPSAVAATMGIQEDVGELLVCVALLSNVYLVDPLSLKRCQFDADAYWRNPFRSLKTGRELVEYVIHDVRILSTTWSYALAETRVARVLDSGSHGAPVLLRTHLGRVLKPGDHALGYDLSDVEIENCKNMLPYVVLIKKRCLATKLEQEFSRKKASPEYEQFLNDLDKNPEAMFNLSLNAGDAEEQTPVKPEDLGLDLEDLLADLNLSDH